MVQITIDAAARGTDVSYRVQRGRAPSSGSGRRLPWSRRPPVLGRAAGVAGRPRPGSEREPGRVHLQGELSGERDGRAGRSDLPGCAGGHAENERAAAGLATHLRCAGRKLPRRLGAEQAGSLGIRHLARYPHRRGDAHELDLEWRLRDRGMQQRGRSAIRASGSDDRVPRRGGYGHRREVPRRGRRPPGARGLRAVPGAQGAARAELGAAPGRAGAPWTGSPSPTPTSTTSATCRGCAGTASARRPTRRRPRPRWPGSCCPTPATSRRKRPRTTTARKTSKHTPALPLYTAEEGLAAAIRVRGVAYDHARRAGAGGPGVVPPRRAHRRVGLGGARPGAGADRRRVVFSGDLGRPHAPILPDPAPIGEADYVVVESTYGDRRARPRADRRAARAGDP